MAIVSLSLCVSAAVPVEEDIIDKISTPNSKFFYPDLMLRFQMGDETLSLEDYHYLYYGYAYQDQYKPLNTNPYMDKFLLMASGLDVESPNMLVVGDLISIGQQALEFDPFNPKVWNMLAYAYSVMGNREMEEKASRRVMMILEVIRRSGDGLKERSPQHILMFDHALDLLAAENFNHLKARVISRTVEYVPLVAPQKFDGVKIKGFFFDFGRIYWNKPDSVTYKRDRTWQFNNLPVREYK